MLTQHGVPAQTLPIIQVAPITPEHPLPPILLQWTQPTMQTGPTERTTPRQLTLQKEQATQRTTR